MESRRLAGIDVSVVGLGTNNFGRNVDAAGTARVVHAAIAAGVTLIDTADKYGDTRSEEHIGRALEGHRDSVVIATKFGIALDDDPANGGAGRRWMRTAVEGSLRRLRTDYIDLYQLHWPDESTPIEETLEGLAELVREGKVRAVGCSNFTTAQLEEAVDAATGSDERAAFASAQNEYNLLQRDVDRNGLLATCERNDIGFMPYYPLASGLLTGKYQPASPPAPGTRFATVDRYNSMWTERNLQLAAKLNEFASSRDRSPTELAISWLLSRPAVASVICGATKPEQVASNARSAGWKFEPAELEELDRLTSAG